MSGLKKGDWTTDEWVKKLKQQADDSKEYRHTLYRKVGLKTKRKVLDVGCGTGAITADIATLINGDVTGIDIDPEKLEHAKRFLSDVRNVTLVEADVLELPFHDETFDLVVFNIVLIYVKDQQKAVNEMARVTRKNSIVLGTLETDYLSRFGYPEDPVYPLILKDMEKIGADLCTGRKLRFLFSNAGLETEIGIDAKICGILTDPEKRMKLFLDQFWYSERLLKNDGWTPEHIEEYKRNQIEMIEKGLSFSFLPCFYVIGRKY